MTHSGNTHLLLEYIHELLHGFRWKMTELNKFFHTHWWFKLRSKKVWSFGDLRKRMGPSCDWSSKKGDGKSSQIAISWENFEAEWKHDSSDATDARKLRGKEFPRNEEILPRILRVCLVAHLFSWKFRFAETGYRRITFISIKGEAETVVTGTHHLIIPEAMLIFLKCQHQCTCLRRLGVLRAIIGNSRYTSVVYFAESRRAAVFKMASDCRKKCLWQDARISQTLSNYWVSVTPWALDVLWRGSFVWLNDTMLPSCDDWTKWVHSRIFVRTLSGSVVICYIIAHPNSDQSNPRDSMIFTTMRNGILKIAISVNLSISI